MLRCWQRLESARALRVHRLINHEGMSVLFHHSTLAVVESANGTAPQLPADVALTGVGRTRDDAKYFVLLQQSTTKNVTGQSAHEWQHTVTRDNPKMRVVFANNTAMLMSANPLDWPKSTDLSADAEADDVFEGLELPKHTHYLPLHEPLTERAHENIRQVEQKMSAVRNVVIERLVEEVSAPALQRTVEHLATTWLTRQAATPGSWACADYLKQEFEQLGFETSFGGELRDGFSPNVVATKTGTRYPTRWVVIGAHYDSRGRNAADPEEIAPGANDDGSGIAAIVEMARITQAMGATYDYSLMIVGFAAEEQGLVGSNELAQRMLDDGDEIIGMYAADMIGYRVPGRNIQVGLPIVSHTPALTSKSVCRRMRCASRVLFFLDSLAHVTTAASHTFQLSRGLRSTCTCRKSRPASIPAAVLTTSPFTIVDSCVYSLVLLCLSCCESSVTRLLMQRTVDMQPASRFFEACGALDDPKYHTPEVRPKASDLREFCELIITMHGRTITRVRGTAWTITTSMGR